MVMLKTLFFMVLLFSNLFSNSMNPDNVIYVFTSSTCKSCEERIKNIVAVCSESVIVKHDIREKKNLMLFKKIVNIIGEPFLPLPLFGIFEDGELKIIAAGDISKESWRIILKTNVEGIPVYVSDGSKRGILKRIIKSEDDITKLEMLFLGIQVQEENTLRLFPLILLTVTAAFIDAINPCALSILLFLLTLIIYTMDGRKVLKIGLSFTIAIYIVYFLIGIGLLPILTRIIILRYVLVIFAFSIGSLNIIDSFKGKRCSRILKIFAKKINLLLESVSNVWTAFIIGAIVAFFILPCSSAPYFLILTLFSEKTTLYKGMLLLSLYNLIIILPFIILTLLTYKLNEITNIKIWIIEKRRSINLIMGMGLILLSIIFLFYSH